MSPVRGSADGGMRAAPPTPSRVHAQRVVTRRLESALVGRDPHADPSGADPGRTRRRALVVGAALGVLALGVAAVVGLVRGDTDWRAAVIVRGTPSGTLLVVAHGPDRLVPTTDLASARLLAAGVDPARADPSSGDGAVDPMPVRDDALVAAPRTAPAGLAGAPSELPDTGTPPVADAWAVCDAVRDAAGPAADPAALQRATAVLGGFPSLGRPLGGDEAVLLRGDDGVTWLVADGRRAALDPTQGAVVRALGIAGEPARPVGSALLGTLPVGAPLVPPRVAGAGVPPSDPATRALGLAVGSVATTGPPASPRFVLVLDRGVQEVPAVVAQLVRFADPTPGADPGIATVPTAAVAGLPRAAGVDLGAYPRDFPRLLGVDTAPVVCAQPSARPGVATAITVAGTLPTPVPPTPASDPTIPGPRAVDAVRIAGSGAYVVPVGPGEQADPARGVVVDTVGRVFPVPGVRAATALGLGAPRPAPRSVVGLLPRGPALDVDAARTLR
ncbi:type VII secretion protein EccB [Actinomycetospora endophytica]|uniref:Type VII secretion protein EccB n=1 Tax=Actinomycetospora endophytica TaxID=2291215 RepID=A0ABS8P9N4_9PSEU|nr:type VII secretion protein EccB [Actinomycetospora endophytica]MCD2194980.1 type VII secretion protein EccB [Actinomycetospora endophytica]